jgi:hypothetical protein
MNAVLNAIPVLQTKSVRLGLAPRGATLNFQVQDGAGFEAHAILLLGTQTISTWVSSELIGKVATVDLVSPGQYQLQVTCPYTAKKPTSIGISFEVLANGTKITSRTKNFSGQVPDSARAIADVFVP